MTNGQMVLACDDNGKLIGEYVPRELAHTGSGNRHLAITVLLKNSNGELLLQKRKHKRFNDIWDFTGATDVLHQEKDESFGEATLRCLKREYGIEGVKVRKFGAFNYFAKYNGECENEHCAMMVGEYDGEVEMNPEVGYGYKWMDQDKFLKDIKENPQNYSPWAIEGVKILERTGFFNT